MKIIADDKIPFLQGVFEPYAEVEYLPGKDINADAVKDADAMIIRTRTRCNRELLSDSKVRYIATATIGFDHLDTAVLGDLGISWSNAPGCNAASVAQYISAVLLGFNTQLAGKTLGVIGVGNVGKLVAAVGRALGMQVLLNDPPRAAAEGGDAFVSLEALCRESDFITVHVPKVKSGTWPTVNLIDRKIFELMKPGAYFINSSRGEAVDETALKEAISSGKLAGAALDVWLNEPEIDRELLDMVDFATPHIAGYSTDGKGNGTTASVHFIAGKLNIPELAEWQAKVPPPANDSIITASRDEDDQQLLKRAVFHTFDLQGASDSLKADPASFETLRGNAPLRREAPAYTVSGAGKSAAEHLSALGFNID